MGGGVPPLLPGGVACPEPLTRSFFTMTQAHGHVLLPLRLGRQASARPMRIYFSVGTMWAPAPRLGADIIRPESHFLHVDPWAAECKGRMSVRGAKRRGESVSPVSCSKGTDCLVGRRLSRNDSTRARRTFSTFSSYFCGKVFTLSARASNVLATCPPTGGRVPPPPPNPPPPPAFCQGVPWPPTANQQGAGEQLLVIIFFTPPAVWRQDDGPGPAGF